jgi:hypothetical protein
MWLCSAGKEGLLFVNKKKQKNFDYFGPRWFYRLGLSLTKVFWFFFSSKSFMLFEAYNQ